MTVEQKKNIGIGMLVAVGLGYILGRIPLVSQYTFYITIILAVYLIFFSKS